MKTTTVWVVLLGMLAAKSSAGEERENLDTTVKTAERFYRVTYPNGQTDRFVFVFTAHVVSYMKQDGESSSWKHPHDTRRCTYSVKSYIQRDGYYVTGGGKRVPLNDVHEVYGASSGAYKSNDILEQTLGQHSPCNKFVGDFNDMKARISSAIIRDFDTFLLTDVFKTSAAKAERAMGNATLVQEEGG